MTPDVTIKISFDADGTASASAASTTSAAAPPPIAVDALNVAASSSAPSPMTPAELARSQGVASSDEPPAPMPIEQLLSTESAAAPVPEPLGALQTVGGPPPPLSLAELGIAAGSEVAPPPEPDYSQPQASTRRRGATKRSEARKR